MVLDARIHLNKYWLLGVQSCPNMPELQLIGFIWGLILSTMTSHGLASLSHEGAGDEENILH